MTQIKSNIFPDVEAFLKENLRDFFVDNVAAVYPVSDLTDDLVATYEDEEENETKTVDSAGHVAGLRKLCELVDKQELFVGGVRAAIDLVDPCNWDVEVVDAYFQLLYHGEVIYG